MKDWELKCTVVLFVFFLVFMIYLATAGPSDCRPGYVIINYCIGLLICIFGYFEGVRRGTSGAQISMASIVLLLIGLYQILIVLLWAINGCKSMSLRSDNNQSFIETGEHDFKAAELILSIVIFIIVLIGIDRTIIV